MKVATSHRARTVWSTVAAFAAVAMLASCGSPVPVTRPATENVSAPRPVGAEDPAKIPEDTADADTDCDPRASLRPGAGGFALQRIRERGRLLVGVDQNTYLFGFRDPSTGELSGFDVDIAREIARAIFGDPGKVQFKAASSADRIKRIQSGEVDIVVQTMTMNCERWREVHFSTEYYSAGQRVLVMRGSGYRSIDDLGGKKVCAAAGSTSIRAIAAAKSKPKPVAVRDWTDCLVMLQQNQVTAISTDDAILAGLTKQDPNTEVVGPQFTDEPYGIAVARSAPDLVRFVNGVLDRLRSDGTWVAIHRKWLASTLGSARPPAPRYRD